MNVEGGCCTQCGSRDVALLTKNTGRCNHCGTEFVLAKEQSNEAQTPVAKSPEKGRNIPHQGDMQFMALKPVWTPEQFAREAYIRLFSELSTPLDIYKAEFMPVVTEYPQFTIFIADYELKYTVDIGHDRKETYVDTEKKTVDGRLIDKPVIKERTVTDWTPFSGEYKHGKAVTLGAVSLPEKKELYADFETSEVSALQKCLRAGAIGKAEAYDDSEYSVDIVLPSQGDIQRAIKLEASELAAAYAKTLPGDRTRRMSYTTKAKEDPADWLLAPEYVLGFRYGGEAYEIRGFAAETQVRLCKIPKVNESAEKEQIREEMKPQQRKTLWLPIIAMAVLFLLLSRSTTGGLFAILLGPLGIAYWWLHLSYWARKEKEAIAGQKVHRQKTKMDQLQKCLASLGAEPLSEKESVLFDVTEE